MPPTGTFWETAPSSAAWGQPGSRMVQTFSPDSRNQVTSISRSGTMTVAGGTTHKASSVTVNGNAATLYGDNTFARTGISLVNGNNTFTAIANDGFGSADTNVVTVFLPSSTSPTHDANGNMLTSGNRSYQYDDENQLIAVHVANTWRSEFVYDGMMRRRIQKDFSWSGSSWTQTNETRYIYFGRLLIQERNSQNVAVKGYTRGLDLSGSLSGAGGIGGVLSFTELFTNAPNRNFFYFSDAGGNITKIFDHGRNIRGTVCRIHRHKVA